ncbi:MAG: LarC family nickel insertion protein [Deltaproteobacteria bacterium]|nr:LarC family nickel insertion protein [Deltaproteobacteria bacterium]
MGKRLLIDCSSGLSGDMFLSALADLGADFSPLQEAFRKSGLDVLLRKTPLSRMGGPGLRTEIIWSGEHPLRHLPELTALIEGLDLPEAVRRKAGSMLLRLGETEALAHGTTLDEVHFHEVGAIDTLADVLGAVLGLLQLEVEEVLSGPLPWFSGFVDCAHGRLALPAPATARLMQGKPVFNTPAREELITPTGALLLDTLVDRFLPAGGAGGGGQEEAVALFERSGLGYGSREPSEESSWPGRGLRLHLFDLSASAPPEASGPYIRDEVGQISCSLDHMSGEELGLAIRELGALALDVLWLPGVTKKNRPGGELRVLCRPEDMPRMQEEVFKRTHSLGLRLSRLARVTLPRGETVLDSPWGPLRAKEYILSGRRFVRAEHEALAEKASSLGLGLPALRGGPSGTKPD